MYCHFLHQQANIDAQIKVSQEAKSRGKDQAEAGNKWMEEEGYQKKKKNVQAKEKKIKELILLDWCFYGLISML